MGLSDQRDVDDHKRYVNPVNRVMQDCLVILGVNEVAQLLLFIWFIVAPMQRF